MASLRFQLSAIKCVVWLHAPHVKCLLMMCRFDWLDRLTMIGYGSGNLSLVKWRSGRFSDSTFVEYEFRFGIVDIAKAKFICKIRRENCVCDQGFRGDGPKYRWTHRTNGYFGRFAILMVTQLHTCWHPIVLASRLWARSRYKQTTATAPTPSNKKKKCVCFLESRCTNLIEFFHCWLAWQRVDAKHFTEIA